MKSLFNKIAENTEKIMETTAVTLFSVALISSLYINYDLYQDNKRFEAEIIKLKEENKALNLYGKKVEEIGKKYLEDLEKY